MNNLKCRFEAKCNVRPIADARPRFSTHNGLLRVYKPAKVEKYKRDLVAIFRSNWPYKQPISQPVFLDLEFVFKTSDPKRIDKINVNKPDLSNLVKAVEDALVLAGVLEDDRLIYGFECYKRWGISDLVWVRLYAQSD